MPFESVDQLQKTLSDTVFSYAADSKKAAGRALGTLVEIITYYTLRSWGLRDQIIIERSVPEFGNPAITHNVEFSMHPLRSRCNLHIQPLRLPITPTKLRSYVPALNSGSLKSTQLVSASLIKRNSAVLAEYEQGPIVANLDSMNTDSAQITICELSSKPFAIFECKRVGVEEGMKKGPQTIEKAKQGAYVAARVSSLQKVRRKNGELLGLIENSDGTIETGPYLEMLTGVIDATPGLELDDFILSVGVVSNHGNWFTAETQNKEMRVLAQSYDWLLFLTDHGLSQFIDKLLLNPSEALLPARNAFLASYNGEKGGNRFTKVSMCIAADEALQQYFVSHEAEVESWFNVIAPKDGTLELLRGNLHALTQKLTAQE